MSGPLRIAVVGNGVAGAMAAAMLAVELPRPRFQVTIVPAGVDQAGPVFAGDPSMRRLHARLGLTDAALVQSAGASFTLGAAYAGWSRRRPAYFSPFGDIGAVVDGVPFHQLIARLRREGGDARLGDFSLATLLAQAGRFRHPSDDPASPLSTFSYGLHVDCAAYASILLDIARRNGADLRESVLAEVELDQTGLIGALRLHGGERLPVDLVIDASMDGAAIAAGDSGWESWAHLFPCDRVAHGLRQEASPPAPYSLAEARAEGWIYAIPCQQQVGETLFYSSDRLDQAGAEQLLAARGASASIRHSSFQAGRRKSPWSRNCIAIGAAAFSLEPLHPGPMQLLVNGIERLLRLFPAGESAAVEAREFNRETADELDRTRDLALLRYLINDRSDSLWEEARNVSAPPELERKIAAFRSRGSVPMVDGDLFDEPDWTLIFDEHGVRPARHDQLADAMPPERLGGLLDRMRQLLTATAAAQPLHGEYLAKLRHKAAA